jgi:anthranilate synthase component 1
MVRFFEPSIPAAKKDELGVPEMFFFIAETVLIFDHRCGVCACLAMPSCEMATWTPPTREPQKTSRRSPPAWPVPPNCRHVCGASAEALTPAANTTPGEYQQFVRDAQEYIHAGDIFQIVPSQRFETDYAGDALTLYRSLRFVNPSPYMFCLKFAGEFALVGSSPEVHVRAMNGHVEIRPIAGTKRRGTTEAEDAENAAALLADPKERAEHLMLVDLARNDVGRIAEFGSVRVTDFMTIEKYSHVMHIVSNVVGELRPDRNALRRDARHLPRRNGERLTEGAGDANHQSAREEQTQRLCGRRGILRLRR